MPPVQLEVVDLGVTEAWLKISVTDVLRPNLIRLRRDGQPLASFTMSGAETLIVDEHLLPNHTYLYEASRTGVIGQLEFPPLRVTTLDSTSHNFTWETDLLGEAGSSGLSDVAILNDTLAYVVGAIYRLDSLGARDPVPYNMAKWNGRSWELQRVTVMFRGNPITIPLKGIFALSPTDIWLTGGLPIHGDGSTWAAFDIQSLPGLDSLSLSSCWALNPSRVYGVGIAGSIGYYDGGTWQKLESGTNVELTDIWGTPDGKEVWACGWNFDNSASVLLRKSNSSWQTLWRPSANLLSSLWSSGSGGFVFTGNGRVWRGSFLDLRIMQQFPVDLGRFAYRIRGASRDDITVAGDLGMIWHWNGVTWQRYDQLLNANYYLYGLAMSKRLILAVGVSYSGSSPRALIIRGRR